MRPFLSAVVLITAAFAVEPGSVCDLYQHSDVIFTGTAQTAWMALLDTHKPPIHKRSEKSRRVRFLVREWYKGRRAAMVEVWMTPGKCELTIQADQTYLIYARANADNGRTESNGCMGTKPVANAADDLRYLTAAQSGPERATRISGSAGNPGVNIAAKSGIQTRYAVSDATGHFTLDGLPAGKWELSIVGGPAKTVELAAGSCAAVDLTP